MKEKVDKIENDIQKVIKIAEKIGITLDIKKIKNFIKEKDGLLIFNTFKDAMQLIDFFIIIGKRAERISELKDLENFPIIEGIQQLYSNLDGDKEVSEQLKSLYILILKFVLPSIENNFALLKIPRKDILEENIRKLFIENYEKAKKLNKRAIAKVFFDMLSYYDGKPLLHSHLKEQDYDLIGVPDSVNDLKKLSLKELWDLIENKQELLFNYEEGKIRNITRKLIRGFGNLIEIELKAVFSMIINLQKISSNESFITPNNLMRYYLNQLSLKKSPNDKGNYLDIRNCDAHDSLNIDVNKEYKKIEIILILRKYSKDGVVINEENLPSLTIQEVYDKMQKFIQFIRIFRRFCEAYIIEWQLKKQGKSYQDVIDEYKNHIGEKNVQEEIVNFFKEIQEKLE